MEKMVIHKNKGEVFKCQLKVDGADIKNTVVRLCLEFDNNKNLFFYGKIDSDGSCSINIPKLKELESNTGRVIVEAIADSTYFRLYENEVELRNSIEIDFVKQANIKESTNITLEKPTFTKETPVQESVIKPEPKELDKRAKVSSQFARFQKYVSKKDV